jgi:methanogenic corrinoid protein MtbC1
MLGAPVPFSRPREPSGTGVLRKRYLAALLAGCRRDAAEILVDEGLWLDVPIPSLYLDVFQRALHEIGRLWQQGRLEVARASLAAEIAKATLAQLRPLLASEPSNGKLVVVACVEGELHDIGAHIVADFLEMSGFDVRFLGANVPTESLVALVREQPPQLLALSATTGSNVDVLRRTVKAVREAGRHRVPIAAGGQAFAWQPSLRKELDLAISAQSASDLASAARGLLDGVTH